MEILLIFKSNDGYCCLNRTYLGGNYFAPKSAPVTNLYTKIGDIPAIQDWVKNRPVSK